MRTLDAHLISPPEDIPNETIDVECPECGADVPAGTEDCLSCGYELDDDYIRDYLQSQQEPPDWA